MTKPKRPPIVVQTDTQERFLKAIDSQHLLAIRTAEAMRKMVLTGPEKTELSSFPAGQVDPQIQLVLIARDLMNDADDMNAKLAAFRSMRDVFLSVDSKVHEVLKMAMQEKHHQENLQVQRERIQASSKQELTEEDVQAIAASGGGHGE